MEEGNKGMFEASFHPKESLAMSFFYSIVYVIYIDEHILKSSISSMFKSFQEDIITHWFTPK